VSSHLIEDAQEVPSADLSDLIRREPGFQHRIDNHIVEPDRLILPCLVGSFPDMRMLLLTGAGAAQRWPTRAGTARTRTVGARTRLS
jgi:hypothetical protein